MATARTGVIEVAEMMGVEAGAVEVTTPERMLVSETLEASSADLTMASRQARCDAVSAQDCPLGVPLHYLGNKLQALTPSIPAYCQRMIREWEKCCQGMETPTAGWLKARERTAAERKSCTSRKSDRLFGAICLSPYRELPPCQENLCLVSPTRIWTNFSRSDPRIAFGKYSPLEKEILRLGGVHTIAARKLLASKEHEERKMMKTLQSISPEFNKVTECKELSSPCIMCKPIEKLWTAKVIIPAEEFKMPVREKANISKHIERMQLARALQNEKDTAHIEKRRGSTIHSGAGLGFITKDKSREGESCDISGYSDNAKQEENEEAERQPVKRQEMNMDVTFKSEEPKKRVRCHRNDCKPFLKKKQERCITGQTNRNLFPLAEFPGDLMLLRQGFIAQGLHPRCLTKTYQPW
ncbi:uncharacterized protein C10orf120 homolog [Perognathus longimembris pacificus]|uniref:uncharacterized protein C10orf120 homolog n=1 Tax=Perognathus longimembris pacificus TaxID=214514 RepID=UPI00201976A1|nr:uncharacterized protein C10orf120 homolog [Perognathus longimembris pacificus]